MLREVAGDLIILASASLVVFSALFFRGGAGRKLRFALRAIIIAIAAGLIAAVPGLYLDAVAAFQELEGRAHPWPLAMTFAFALAAFTVTMTHQCVVALRSRGSESSTISALR